MARRIIEATALILVLAWVLSAVCYPETTVMVSGGVLVVVTALVAGAVPFGIVWYLGKSVLQQFQTPELTDIEEQPVTDNPYEAPRTTSRLSEWM